MPRYSCVLGAFVLACAASGVHSAPVDILASDAGFVTEVGGSAKGDGTIVPSATYNYSVGYEVHYADGALGSPFAPVDRKNYFVFDLSGVTAPISGATLFLYNPGIAAGDAGDGYESTDPTETFEILETTAPGAVLADLAGLASGAGPFDYDEAIDPLVMLADGLYDALGDGPLVLATATMSAADNGTVLALAFTPGGLGYLNSFIGGSVVLAGSLPSATPPVPLPQEVFGYTDPDIPGGDPATPMLSLTTIPVPASLWLFASALGLLGGLRCRQNRVPAGCRCTVS